MSITDKIASSASGIPTPSPIARLLFDDGVDSEAVAGVAVGVLTGSTSAWLARVDEASAWTGPGGSAFALHTNEI